MDLFEVEDCAVAPGVEQICADTPIAGTSVLLGREMSQAMLYFTPLAERGPASGCALGLPKTFLKVLVRCNVDRPAVLGLRAAWAKIARSAASEPNAARELERLLLA